MMSTKSFDITPTWTGILPASLLHSKMEQQKVNGWQWKNLKEWLDLPMPMLKISQAKKEEFNGKVLVGWI
jgi:hypothetical protein